MNISTLFHLFPKAVLQVTNQHWNSIVNEENAILGKVSKGASSGIMMLPSLPFILYINMHSTTYIKALNMMQTLTFSAITFEKGCKCIWIYCICHYQFYNQNFITDPTVIVYNSTQIISACF